MVGCQNCQAQESITARGTPPRCLLVEKWCGFREQHPRGLRDPKAQLIHLGERMVRTVGQQQDGTFQALYNAPNTGSRAARGSARLVTWLADERLLTRLW